MKKILLAVILLSLSYIVNAQLIQSTPQFPTENDSVYIYFNAAEGSKGLMDYTGEIYAHIGVITDNSTSSSDWKYVKTNWGENTSETKLERISSNIYLLKILPNITDYFGVPAGEKILKIAFVFRSSDSALEGKTDTGGDILYDVYEAGLNIVINSPNTSKLIYNANDSVSIDIASSYADSMQIYFDNTLLINTEDSIYKKNIIAGSAGNHKIRVNVYGDSEVINDSVGYYVMGAANVANVPAGMKKGLNIIDGNTVTMVLWAPYKEYVFVIGDFNNWLPDEDYLMNRDADGETYWLTITGLESTKEYIYQYLIDGEIRVADAYSEKISDPWNDKWIPSSTYPNLIQYPDGLTNGIASVLQIQQDIYVWETTDFQAPANEDLIIYELLIRDFTTESDLNAVIEKLNYIEDLGVNAIELLPPSEFEGNDSWGYNPSFYFAFDKAYGPKNMYKKFIDECHKRGIAVIQDIVLNHSYSQSPLVQMYWNGSSVTPENPWYNVTSPNTAYSWGYDFDHESNATVEFMDSALQFWLQEYKIDGYRLDFVKGLTNTPGDGGAYDAARINITNHYYEAAKEINPNVYFILELFADNTEETQLSGKGMMIWGNMNHSYLEGAMGYNSGSDFSWISYQKRGWSDPHLIGYAESHDEERLMFKVLEYGDDYLKDNLWFALPRAELSAVFLLTIPGPKMIWQFGEIGYDYSIDYNGRVGRKPVVWEYFDDNSRKRLYQVYAALNKLRTENAVFSTREYELDASGSIKTVHLHSTEMEVVVAGNYSIEKQSISPNFASTGYWYEYFTGDSINIEDVNIAIDFEGAEYRIYTNVKLSTPDLVTALSTRQIDFDFLLYPNPAKELLRIQYGEQKIIELQIFSLDGKLMQTKENLPSYQAEINTSKLKSGMYILRIIHGQGISTKSFFIQ